MPYVDPETGEAVNIMPPAPPGYYQALGELIAMFAKAETMLYLFLVNAAEMKLPEAGAVFTDARIDRLKDFIKRIHLSRGKTIDPRMESALLQMGEISRMRNDIVHHGLMENVETGEYVCTNALHIHHLDKMFVLPITVELLMQMTADLWVISTTALICWPNKGTLPEQFSEEAVVEIGRYTWRYKPLARVRPERNILRKIRAPSDRPRPSQTTH